MNQLRESKALILVCTLFVFVLFLTWIGSNPSSADVNVVNAHSRKGCDKSVEFWYGVSNALGILESHAVNYFFQGNKKDAYARYHHIARGHNILLVPLCNKDAIMAAKKSYEATEEMRLWFEADLRGETKTAELHRKKYIKRLIERRNLQMKIYRKMDKQTKIRLELDRQKYMDLAFAR